MVIALTAIAMPRALRETLLLRVELVDSVPVLVLVAFVLILGLDRADGDPPVPDHPQAGSLQAPVEGFVREQ